MRKSKLSQTIIAIFNKHPTQCFPITALADELGKTIDRTSPTRVSICRCLNRMYREGIVDYEYDNLFPKLVRDDGSYIPNKHAGKYWKLKESPCIDLALPHVQQ